MKKYTFQINWSYPFVQGWKTSGKRFNTIEEAANAAKEWIVTSAENDCMMEVRLTEIIEEPHSKA